MAKNANQVAGKFYIRVDGSKLPIEGTATLKNINMKEREAVVGDEVYGYREKVVAPEVEATITKLGGMSLTKLGEITDATVQVETDTGDTYVIRNAWCSSSGELSSDGSAKLTFTGKKITETLGS